MSGRARLSGAFSAIPEEAAEEVPEVLWSLTENCRSVAPRRSCSPSKSFLRGYEKVVFCPFGLVNVVTLSTLEALSMLAPYPLAETDVPDGGLDMWLA